MHTEVYIDLVFMTNFLMDNVLLRLTAQILHRRTSHLRILSASAVGSACSCLMILFRVTGFLPRLLLHGTAAFLMLRIGLRLKKGSLLLRAMLTLYLTAFLCGGIWDMAGNGEILTFRTFLAFTAGTYLALSTWNYLSDTYRAHMKNIFPVVLTFQNRQITSYGFYDTGNLLEDPVTCKPVSVIEPDTLGQLISTDTLEKLKTLTEEPGELKSTELMGLRPRLLPFYTVGSPGGLILTVRLDDLCIYAPGETVHVPGPLFAMPTEPFTSETEYKVLLNAKLLNQEGKV